MSKPDPAGGSLENILASIRKSLSEQSTDALSEASVRLADQDKDTRPQRKRGLTQRLAGATPETSSANAEQAGDDLSDLLEGSPGNVAAAAEAAPSPAVTPETASADPLWFLTRREEPAREAGLPPAEAPSEPKAKNSAGEPKLTRPEVLRASMPPFFGSSAEAAKPASTPVEPAAQAANSPPVAARPQSAAPPAPAVQPGADAAIAREVSLVAAAAEAAAARPVQPAPQPVLNGKGPAVAAPPTDAAAAVDTPHNRALEAMVLDLLKPMLRQWLDQNMPRLVAEALGEEVQRTRATEAGAKKT